MKSYWLCAKPGISQRRIGSKNHFVCSAEKASVDMMKIAPDHTMAGPQVHNHRTARGAGVFAGISEKLGAGRGLRQGWESTIRVQFPSLLVGTIFDSPCCATPQRKGEFSPSKRLSYNERQ